MAEMKNRGDLRAWLEGKPREVVVGIAVRSALRAVPFLSIVFERDYEKKSGLTLASFHAIAIAWTSAFGYNRKDAQTRAAAAAAYAAAGVRSQTLHALQDDLEALERSESAAETLAHRPLWNGRDEQLGERWDALLERWRNALYELKLGDMAERYDRVYKGGGIDEAEAERRVEAWYAEYQERKASKDEEEKRQAKPKRKTKSKTKTTTKAQPKAAAQEKKSTESDPSEATPPVPEPAPPLVDLSGSSTGQADAPSPVDSLGRRPLVETLAELFAHPEQATPMTLALLGEWGSGKSSVLLQLKKQIQEKRVQAKHPDGAAARVPCVFAEFNAWEHEQCDDIQAGLAQAVVTGLTSEINWFHRMLIVIRFAFKEHPAELWKLVGAAVLLVGGAAGVHKLGDFVDGPFYEGLAGTSIGAGVVAFFVYLWKNGIPILEAPVWREMYSYIKLPDYQNRMGQVPVMKRHLKALGFLRKIGPKPPKKNQESEEQSGKGCDRNRLVLYVDDLDRQDARRGAPGDGCPRHHRGAGD